jgi:ribosomal protein S18 acetylase RimI-like enzyme
MSVIDYAVSYVTDKKFQINPRRIVVKHRADEDVLYVELKYNASLVGYMELQICDDTAFLELIEIAPALQGRGFASKLFFRGLELLFAEYEVDVVLSSPQKPAVEHLWSKVATTNKFITRQDWMECKCR